MKSWILVLALLVCTDFSTFVFRDINRNGTQDEGEGPAANYTVFYSPNNPGISPAQATSYITDETGHFCWPGGYGVFDTGCATTTINAGSSWPKLPACPLFVYLATIGGPQ